MFIIAAFITLVLVVYFTLHNWLKPSLHAAKKNLQNASNSISLGNLEKAEQTLLPMIGRYPEASLLYGQVLRKSNRLEEALAIVNQAAREHPEELLFRLEEGKILLGLGATREALDAFNVCTPIIRKEFDCLAYATALLEAGFPAECWEWIKPFLNSTQNGEVLNIAASALYEKREFADAIMLYTQTIRLGYKNHQVLTQLAHAYRRLGNLNEAENIFHDILEKDTGDIAATLGLGACLQERGMYQKALLVYQSGQAWGSQSPLVMEQAGVCALYCERFKSAEDYFFEAMQCEQTTPKLLSYYGYSLECQCKWQEAEQAYLRLIHLFPSYPNGYRALAWMFGVGLATTVSYEQGINFAHLALNLLSDTISWEILSACEARTGNYARAYQIQEYLMASDKDPECRSRRQHAMRQLRKNTPLNDHLVYRTLVA